MDKLLDLDKLDAEYKRKRKIRILFAIPALLVACLIVAGMAANSMDSSISATPDSSNSPSIADTNSGQVLAQSTQQASDGSTSIDDSKKPTTPTTPDLSYTSTPVASNPVPSLSPTSSNMATPDRTKCPGIRAQMANATADLEAQAAQLRSQIQTEQSYVTNNNSYSWQNGYGQATPVDTSSVQAKLQRDQQELNSIISQINSIDNSYIPQLTGNMCSL